MSLAGSLCGVNRSRNGEYVTWSRTITADATNTGLARPPQPGLPLRRRTPGKLALPCPFHSTRDAVVTKTTAAGCPTAVEWLR
jgi:hypothetical protein